jgi:TctA family transporter
MYGGSTTSILVNIPGEAASVVTCIDGHQMAKQGRAGPALGISALGSFIAGTFSLVALMLIAPSLANVAIVRASRVLQPDGSGTGGSDVPHARVDGQGAADGLH